jgi:hypothetical protein
VRISDGRVSGSGSAADIAAGIRWAVDNGARVLNMSLGGTSDTQVERDAVAYAIAHGAVVVAAMGNDFNNGNPTSFPAAYPGVIAVGAITSANAKAGFSNTGSHIDVAAPGVGILSTLWDNGFGTMDGTSMASPHVAGLAALVLSCNANLTAAQVGDIIRQTARPLRMNPADPVPNDAFGFGCIDAEAAINRACPRPSIPITSCPAQSTIVVCNSTLIRCTQPSQTVRCPSQVTVCPTTQVVCTRPTQLVSCPSTVVLCPQPSRVVRCPSGLVCGPDPGRPPLDPIREFSSEQPDPLAGGDWSNDDPYGGSYGGGEGGA